tara:strand:- start:281 stop:403 length:123 start_codon:yes stop_codon:yes gene_type:complete
VVEVVVEVMLIQIQYQVEMVDLVAVVVLIQVLLEQETLPL